MQTIHYLLRNNPPGFYTRGGDILWKKIKSDIGGLPLPDSFAQFRQLFESSFEKNTGYKISHEHIVYVQALDTGGMSGGQVLPTFFQEAILSFLESKYFGLNESTYKSIFRKYNCG
jgi:hypothetical protein